MEVFTPVWEGLGNSRSWGLPVPGTVLGQGGREAQRPSVGIRVSILVVQH